MKKTTRVIETWSVLFQGRNEKRKPVGGVDTVKTSKSPKKKAADILVIHFYVQILENAFYWLALILIKQRHRRYLHFLSYNL